jgi:uncharacterized protein (TIGR01244 family)
MAVYNENMTTKIVALPLLFLLAVFVSQLPGGAVSDELEAPNVLWVQDDVCIAGQPTAEDFRRLKEKGVRSVVSLRAMEEDPFLEQQREIVLALGMNYFHIPVAREAAPPDHQYREFLALAREPANRPVFYHCASGSRIAAFWAVYRVEVHGWSLEKAEEEARRIGAGKPEPIEYARDYLARNSH